MALAVPGPLLQQSQTLTEHRLLGKSKLSEIIGTRTSRHRKPNHDELLIMNSVIGMSHSCEPPRTAAVTDLDILRLDATFALHSSCGWNFTLNPQAQYVKLCAPGSHRS